MSRFKSVLKSIKCFLPTIKHINYYSTQNNVNFKFHKKMTGWQIQSYGDLEELQYFDNIRMPIIKKPTEVLIKIIASSVNPIDTAMIRGYGVKTLNLMRCNNLEFPLTLGRDFTGQIIQMGMSVNSNFDINDIVWGVVPVHNQGCHSDYIVIDSSYISHKPTNIDTIQSSAILYAGLTAWSGIFVTGLLGGLNGALTSYGGGGLCHDKNVLILGASGGVGSLAAQILKAESAHVVATCATDAIDLVKGLGVDHVFDYKSDDHLSSIKELQPYDIILDCANKGTNYVNELNFNYKNYITFNSPLLKNNDQYGVGIGIIENIRNLIENNINLIMKQKSLVKWGYFLPAHHGIIYLKNLVEQDRLKPIIENIYNYEQTFDAYKRVDSGHLRGKIVIEISK